MRASALDGMYMERTPGLPTHASLDDLVKTKSFPGKEGVILTDTHVRFGDLYQLSEDLGVEVSLQRVLIDDEFRLVIAYPPLAHTHLPDAPGHRYPSKADNKAMEAIWDSERLLDPTARAPHQRIVWGKGDADNAIFYGYDGAAQDKTWLEARWRENAPSVKRNKRYRPKWRPEDKKPEGVP